MTPLPSSSPADANARRSILAWTLFPLSLFPLMALLTYDWHAISALNSPPALSSNWIGTLGDCFAYYGYLIFGLGIWIVPPTCFVAAFLNVRRRRKTGGGKIWFVLFMVSVACLLQVCANHTGALTAAAAAVNTPCTGGAVGYLVMTRCLSPLISDFGSAIVIYHVLKTETVQTDPHDTTPLFQPR